MATDVVLRLTEQEVAALDALTAGVGQLAEHPVDPESAVAAALDLCLTRLLEDFELPDASVRERVSQAQEDMRRHWSRGKACF